MKKEDSTKKITSKKKTIIKKAHATKKAETKSTAKKNTIVKKEEPKKETKKAQTKSTIKKNKIEKKEKPTKTVKKVEVKNTSKKSNAEKKDNSSNIINKIDIKKTEKNSVKSVFEKNNDIKLDEIKNNPLNKSIDTKKDIKKLEFKNFNIKWIKLDKIKLIYLIYLIPLVLAIIAIIVGSTLLFNKKIIINKDDISSIKLDINPDNGDESINWDKYEEQDIELSESFLINKGGIYNLSGTINNGLIKIDTADNVKLILNNVRITNDNGPAINVINAETVLIYLPEGTTSSLTDSKKYKGFDNNIKGCIYADADLVFDGNGTLNVTANYKDGIVSKEDLKFINGNYNIISDDDGIRGTKSVYIKDGNFNIYSKGDGIKSTKADKLEKGFIRINTGIFNITSTTDGIKAENDILIKGGNFTIKTGGGSTIDSINSSNWGYWGQKSNKESMTSAKGIVSKDSLIIEAGIFNLDTSDDGIHSGNELGIKDGQFYISSGDDGIHVTNKCIIDNGLINIQKGVEGIEASRMTINGGTINIKSIDDGLNIAGGKDSSSSKRTGATSFNKRVIHTLIINEGNIYINSDGDGIDVNGSAYIYGGNIIIDGPTDGKNGALDYDNELIVDKGTLLAGGSSGMARSISSSSKQNNLFIGLNTTINEGNIRILNENNEEIINYEVHKKMSTLVVSSEKLKTDGSYKIMVNDHEYAKFTIKTTTTQIGSGGNIKIK